MNSEREIISRLCESYFDLKGYHWYPSSASGCSTGYRRYRLDNPDDVVDISAEEYYNAYDEYRSTTEEDDSEPVTSTPENEPSTYYVLRTNPDGSNSIYYYDKQKKLYVWSDVKAGVSFAKTYSDKSKADRAAKRLSRKYPDHKFSVEAM